MNPDVTLPKFPVNLADIEAAIAAAPEHVEDPECPYDPNDPKEVEAFWKDAVTVKEGGYTAVREALTEKRRLRGTQMHEWLESQQKVKTA